MPPKFCPTRLSLCSLLALLLAGPAQPADPGYRIAREDALPGAVRWDYLSFDTQSQRLFIARGDQVDVVDTVLGRIIGTIANTQGVHGVALASDLDKGYTSNGRTNTVTVFELSSLKILATLPTGKKPDAIVYDPHTRRVFAANGEAGTLTVIDATADQVIATVTIGGKLEFEAVDGKGLLYVNVEDSNALVIVDAVQLSVLARHDLSTACEAPTGLSIDPVSERLFVGCGNRQMAVVSGKSGAILAALPIGKGCDATAYDIERRLAFASNADGTLSIIDADRYAVVQTLVTRPTARTMALDSVGHRIFTVAAKTEPLKADQKRPTLVPNTFTLMTITQ